MKHIIEYQEVKSLKFGEKAIFTCKLCGEETIKEKRSIKESMLCNSCSHKEATKKIDYSSVIDQRKKTCLIKYGVDSPLKAELVKEKIRQTSIKKYGVPYHQQNEIQYKKIQDSIQNKYGVDNIFKDKETMVVAREKAKKTMFDRYGVEYTMESSTLKEKHDATMIERYGAKCACGNKEINEKKKETNFKKYGTRAFNTEKSKQTFMEKYGVEWNSQAEECKESRRITCLEKYGVDNPWKSEDVRNKIKNTMLERYGIENGAFLLKKGYAYYYEDNIFDSSWELAYWIYCNDFGIKIERNYNFIILRDGHKFYPDFKKENYFVEIKSNFWKKAQGNWENKKLSCIENNIEIIDDSKIGLYLNYIKDTYPKNYLKSYRSKKDEN
jgi:hypothetical protein